MTSLTPQTASTGNPTEHLIGQARVLATAVRNVGAVERLTNLEARLRHGK
jgi:hypothetical protein